MIVKKHKSIKHLLRACATSGKITTAANQAEEEMALTWACSLAKQMSELATEVLDSAKPISIFIAGAESETQFPDAYLLLNRLLGTGIEIRLHLIGPDVVSSVMFPIKLTKNYLDDKITVNVDSCLLGAAVEKYGIPDLLVMNNPGLEMHGNEWFSKDEGFASCFEAGVPIVGGSYGYDEYEIDNFALNSFGYELEKHLTNSLALSPMPTLDGQPQSTALHKKVLDMGVADSLRTIWRISNKRVKPDAKALTTYEKGQRLISDTHSYLCSMGYIEQSLGNLWPSIQAEELILETDRSLVRIFRTLAYNFKTKRIIHPESGDVFMENVELPSQFTPESLKRMHNIAMMMVYVRSEVLDLEEAEEFLDYADGDSISDDDDFMGAESVEGILGDSMVSDMMETLFGRGIDQEGVSAMMDSVLNGSKPLSQAELKRMNVIDNILQSGNPAELDKIELSELEAYRNEQGGGIAHTVCDSGDVPMLTKLKQKGVAFNGLDGDRYSVLDVCTDRERADALAYILENHLADEVINGQFTLSMFTPLHRAALIDSPVFYDTLIKYGADAELKNTSGMTAKEIREKATCK